MKQHLDKHSLIYKFQSDFRKKFSIDFCLVQVSDYIINGMGKGLHTEMILIDLQKTFDTLNTILCVKKWSVWVLKNQ